MITILIAVYNAERWLSQCLDSLKAQTFSDFEAIAIDDCSTDRSPAILDHYAATDSRFRAIHLDKNGGCSKARNIGLAQARGEWVTMLDSDDWYAPDTLQLAMQQSHSHPDADCILLRCRYVHPSGEEEELPLSRTAWTPQQAVSDAIKWDGIHGLYLIRTAIHRQYPYDEADLLYSDENTTRLHFLHSRLIIPSDGTYYYRQQSASTTHQVSPRRFDIIAAHANLQRALDADPLATDDIRQQLRNQRWYELTGYWHYFYANSVTFTNQKKIICENLRLSYKELIGQHITAPVRHHFGYWPLRPFWLYELQVRVYYLLRKLIKRT